MATNHEFSIPLQELGDQKTAIRDQLTDFGAVVWQENDRLFVPICEERRAQVVFLLDAFLKKNKDVFPYTESGNNLQNFTGINYFDSFDKKYITIDTAPRSIPGAQTIHFDPNSGILYVFETKDSHSMRSGFAFNLRTQKYLSSHKKDQNPLQDEKLLEAIKKLGTPYDSWIQKPHGYPETQNAIKSITQKSPIAHEAIPDSVASGDYVLFYDSLGILRSGRISSIEPIEIKPDDGNKEYLEGVYRVYPYINTPSIEINGYDFHSRLREEDNAIIGAVIPANSKMRLDGSPVGFWKITQENYEQLQQYTEITYDPSLEYPLTRSEYVTAVAIDGMAFERWAAGINSISSKNPERYEGVTKESLAKAVDRLINRFGENVFSNSCKWLIYQHLRRLHTPKHRTNIFLGQNSDFDDVHSDIIGFEKSISGLARNAIDNAHPVAIDMEVDGYGAVGKGVYNAKSIFGDLELLEILSDKYPKIFRNLLIFSFN